jgi:hypothetical protein
MPEVAGRVGGKAKGFEERWDYPRGFVAMDGKHVVVQVRLTEEP